MATDQQRLSAALVFVAVLATVLLCLLTIRPFADFAYGPDPGPLVEALDRWDHTAIALSVAEALEDARAKNVAAIDAKAGWFAYALVSFALSVAGLGWLVYVGAVS